jgi:hypothetical protein
MDPATLEHRRNYLGSGAADTNVSYNKKGGLLKAQAPMKKQAYKKGGMVKPKGHGMKEEAMEMKGGRYRGGMKEEMAEMGPMRKKGPMPMMKKGGAIKAPVKKMMKGGMTSQLPPTKAPPGMRPPVPMPTPRPPPMPVRLSNVGGSPMMKPVMKKAGGKVAAKPVKKMMGGGRAMYAKGGMARGCK